MRIFSALLAGLLVIACGAASQAGINKSISISYKIKAEWRGPCRRTETINVDLGNAPEVFVRAAACQILGHEPDAETVTIWAEKLRDDPIVQRIDVIKSLCNHFNRACTFRYTDPWVDSNSPGLIDCVKRGRRDIGAVVMFFFHCPNGDNCRMDWASSHAPGMDRPDRRLGFGKQSTGYYDASNPGFWAFELRQARVAGLQLILPNVYGPDMADGQIDTLAEALKATQGPVKIGLFDDTWAWGQKIGGETKFGEPWATAPDLSDANAAADRLYHLKWQPFFRKISARNWYRIDGRPVIYFYNAGTLKPTNRAAAVIARMKALFKADFGIDPFVAVDDAFFADPDMAGVADSRFRWDTFSDPFTAADGTLALKDGISRSTMHGRVVTSAMVRWDSRARDALEGNAQAFAGRTVKGPERLQAVLDATQDADSLVLETWNDLGEGTGIDFNYDYYYKGGWLQPDAFIRQIRASQCSNGS